jgi:hypothetical protein
VLLVFDVSIRVSTIAIAHVDSAIARIKPIDEKTKQYCAKDRAYYNPGNKTITCTFSF